MLHVDTEVFKLEDPRVKSLESGKLSVQGLIYTISPGDYLILHKDTVYALTETQYLAAQDIAYRFNLDRHTFQTLLQKPPIELSQKDAQRLRFIKEQKGNCSSCQYKRYKAQVQTMLKNYEKLAQTYFGKMTAVSIKPYPKCTSPVKAKVSRLFPKFFDKTQYSRKPCLDCVQKHVGMAYIKGCQAQQGYPQHFVLAVANLQEAYEQCPKDCTHLRDLILFCISKSKAQGKLFVPISSILYIINLSRSSTNIEEANDENKMDQNFDLQLNDDMKAQLMLIPVVTKARLVKELNTLIAAQYSENADPNLSIKWQGYMGSLADAILPYSKNVANMIRNRRLMFKAAPQIVRNTEYDCKDILQAIKTTGSHM